MSGRFALWVFGLLLTTTMWGQDKGVVKGTVTEDATGYPVVDAKVRLKNDITVGDATDLDGNYSIELAPGEYTLMCTYMGMEAPQMQITIVAGKTITQDFVLTTSVDTITAVEVKGGMFDKPLGEQTTSMVIITADKIEGNATREISEALDHTPGLNILDGEPQIRGGSGFTFGVGSKVGIIVDDLPMMSGDAGRPEWDFVPVENIAQIEVVKGASSVLAGSSALSGAIFFRSEFPKIEPVTKLSLYSGFYDTPSDPAMKWWNDFPLISGVKFLHSRQIRNLDLVLGANVNYDHGYQGPPVADEYVVDSISNYTENQMKRYKGRFNFSLRHRSKKFKGLKYGINGNVMYQHSTMVMAWLNDSSGIYRGYPGATFLHDQTIFHVDPFVKLVTGGSGMHQMKARYMYSDNFITGGQSNLTHTLMADYRYKRGFDFLGNLEFVGGLSGMLVGSQAEMYAIFGDPHNDMVNLSGYVQLESKIKKLLTLSGGARLEYFQSNDSITALKPIFRAGANLKLNEGTSFRASFGQGYRFPTITERYLSTRVGLIGVFPNPQLVPEESWNAEAGIIQGFKFKKFKGMLDVAFFWQEYQNTIEYLFGFWGDLTSTEPPAGFKFVNTGHSRVTGIDASFMGEFPIGKHVDVQFMIGYTYLNPKTLNPDAVFTLDNFPTGPRELTFNNTSLNPDGELLKYRFKHNVKSDLEVKFFDFSVGGRARYYSKIENLDLAIKEFEDITHNLAEQQNIRYMDWYRERNDGGNMMIDVRVGYEIKRIHTITLVVNNVANRTYSLRPLKVEKPREFMLQYSLRL